jgi:hypothetical protein
MIHPWFLTTIVILVSGIFVRAEVVSLRNGKHMGATCLSGNAGAIDFLSTEGERPRVPLGHIEALTFRTSRTQAGSQPKGGDLIQLKVVLIKLGNTSYRAVAGFSETTSWGEGKQTAREVVGGAGLGAIVGGVAGRGKGAGTGALVDVAGGTLIAATGQPDLKVPSETRLEFPLIMDWQILKTFVGFRESATKEDDKWT